MNEIYKITSITSGYSYIGKTTKGHMKRLREHFYNAKRGQSSHFYNAIRKYGEDDFVIEVIESDIDIDILGDREKYWISNLNTYLGNGYNMNEGGGNGHRPHSEETKKKLSEAFTEERRAQYSEMFTGEGNPMYGNVPSIQWREQHSERMTGERNPMYGLLGELNPNYGKEKPESFYMKHKETWTDEKRKEHGQARLGENNGRYGMEVSTETRQKISESNKNSEKLECPHCGKISNKGNSIRWHFDNCKLKKEA